MVSCIDSIRGGIHQFVRSIRRRCRWALLVEVGDAGLNVELREVGGSRGMPGDGSVLTVHVLVVRLQVCAALRHFICGQR